MPSSFVPEFSTLYPHIDYSIGMAPILYIAGAFAVFYVALRTVCYVVDVISDNDAGYTYQSLFGKDRKYYDQLYKETAPIRAQAEKEKQQAEMVEFRGRRLKSSVDKEMDDKIESEKVWGPLSRALETKEDQDDAEFNRHARRSNVTFIDMD